MIKKTSYRKNLAILIGSYALIGFALLAIVTNLVVSDLIVDYTLITYALKVSVPSAICLAIVAYFIGEILDSSSEKRKKGNSKNTDILKKMKNTADTAKNATKNKIKSKDNKKDPHEIESIFSEVKKSEDAEDKNDLQVEQTDGETGR